MVISIFTAMRTSNPTLCLRIFLPTPIDGKIMILMKATKQRWQHIITYERPGTVLQRAGWALPRPFLYLHLFFTIKRKPELGLHPALPSRRERDRKATDVTLFVSICALRIVISGENILF
jgi:hypothetical protein